MVLTIKLDVKSAIIYFTFACIALIALGLAFPRLRDFLPSDSSGLASWVQAAGSLLAIAATWYIASADKRERRESEYRLAALDASTMYAELSGVLTTVQIIRSDMTKALMEIDYSRIPAVAAKIQNIKIRPLSEQKDLAVVGVSYFSEITLILRQLAILKSQIFILEFFSKSEPVMFKFSLNEALIAAEKTEFMFAKVTETLKVFAAEQGVTLDDFN